MSKESTIEWTRSTFNPWWGCEKVSPACAHCYAERDAKRYGKDVWGANSQRKMMSDRYWDQPLKWNEEARKDGKPWRVFAGSMCDILEDRIDLATSQIRLWGLIQATPHLTWLLLTKRPERYPVAVPTPWMTGAWPANAWAGTTVENQEWADQRIPHLLKVPAPVRFLSAEPLLGEIDLSGWLWKSGCEPHCGARCTKDMDCPMEPSGAIHWVIAGGESGPYARPSDSTWIREIANQCKSADVPFLFKQWGEWMPSSQMTELQKNYLVERFHGNPPMVGQDQFEQDGHLYRIGKTAAGRTLDGREWDEIPTQPRRTAC